jgi:hypothetical protein
MFTENMNEHHVDLEAVLWKCIYTSKDKLTMWDLVGSAAKKPLACTTFREAAFPFLRIFSSPGEQAWQC